MTKYYEIECLRQERRYVCSEYGRAKEYGFQLPELIYCGSGLDGHYPYRKLYRWASTFDLPFSCPDEIIKDVQHLISTISWDKKSSRGPAFSARILYPYLLKWTRFLIGKNYKLDGILAPGSTFAPDTLFVYPDFVDGDFVQFRKLTRDSCFVSKRLMDALVNCRGVYFRDAVMPHRTAPHQYFRMFPDCFFESSLSLCRSVLLEEFIKDSGNVTFCKKCGGEMWPRKLDELSEAKSNYCRKKRILPSHLIIPNTDIFMNFVFPFKFCFSEKAYSILKHFEIRDLEVTEYEVKDDPLWFDDTYWYNYGIKEYGEE